MAEDVEFVKSAAEIVQRRFDLYRQIGFGMVRTGFSWRHLEVAPGDWSGDPYWQPYFSRAAGSGFRLKLTVETMGGPPAWFLRAHPDAALVNAAGEVSRNGLSPWYPGLRDVLAEKADRLFGRLAQGGFLGAIDWVVADLGPASEPIYPAAWTQGKASCREATPWFYGATAQRAFAAAMARRYGSLTGANARWGTRFVAWDDVRLPAPGEQGPRLWEDAFTWYRDSKRDFVRWQVGNYRRALAAHVQDGAGPRLIIMVPGRHIEAAQWQAAVAGGAPDCQMAVMTDTEFLLDLAQETGCAVQYTADENGDELAYIRDYMRGHGNTEPLWGENVGVPGVADKPGHLVDVALANALAGMDYVRSSRIFEEDGVTPNAVFPALAAACARIRQAWG